MGKTHQSRQLLLPKSANKVEQLEFLERSGLVLRWHVSERTVAFSVLGCKTPNADARDADHRRPLRRRESP